MSDELQKKIFSENLNRLLQGREKPSPKSLKKLMYLLKLLILGLRE